MGARGFPPQPTALKILKGNPGRRPLNDSEPQPDKVMPTCPAWLDATAKSEWKRVTPQLYTMGLLTKIDRSALAMYCDMWSQLLAARKVVKEQGFSYVTESGFVQKRPEVSIYQQAMQTLRGWCHEFGLTPSARGRMTVEKKDDEVDPFELYLAHGGQN